MRDFEGRCAYSCQHYTRAGGEKCIEVDHFDPRQKNDLFQNYLNLFLATRHCNGAKGQRPTARQRQLGLIFINPCEDWDYGKHIFEDPQTHELWGGTPQAKFHIRYCDLNAPHLVRERRERFKLLKFLEQPMQLQSNATFSTAAMAIALLKEQVKNMIPLFLPLKRCPNPFAAAPASVQAQ